MTGLDEKDPKETITKSSFMKNYAKLCCSQMSHYLGRTSVLDFKDVTVPRFGHSDVVFCLLLITNIKRYGMSIISKKCLIAARRRSAATMSAFCCYFLGAANLDLLL